MIIISVKAVAYKAFSTVKVSRTTCTVFPLDVEGCELFCVARLFFFQETEVWWTLVAQMESRWEEEVGLT